MVAPHDHPLGACPRTAHQGYSLQGDRRAGGMTSACRLPVEQPCTLGRIPPRTRTEDDKVSDFRIELPEDPRGVYARELDWDRNAARWSVSERELGSSTWDLDGKASPWDLGEVLRFFDLRDPVEETTLVGMGPGECLLEYANQHNSRDIVGDLCDTCGNHWIVYKRDSSADRWRRYGRTCDFRWSRGTFVEPTTDSILERLIQDRSTR